MSSPAQPRLAQLRRALNAFARERLEDYPDLYLAVQRWRYRGQPIAQHIVDAGTDIVIDGFPRSANSFSVRAFLSAQPAPLRVGHHMHSHAQIVKSVRLGLPTILLIRNPDDCIVSLRAMDVQLAKRGGKTSYGLDPAHGVDDLIRAYIRFYRGVQPVLDGCVLGRFPDVTRRFDTVIAEANQRFGRDYTLFRHTEQAEQAIFSSATAHLGPSVRRNEIKERVAEVYGSPANAGLVAEARGLYMGIAGR